MLPERSPNRVTRAEGGLRTPGSGGDLWTYRFISITRARARYYLAGFWPPLWSNQVFRYRGIWGYLGYRAYQLAGYLGYLLFPPPWPPPETPLRDLGTPGPRTSGPPTPSSTREFIRRMLRSQPQEVRERHNVSSNLPCSPSNGGTSSRCTYTLLTYLLTAVMYLHMPYYWGALLRYTTPTPLPRVSIGYQWLVLVPVSVATTLLSVLTYVLRSVHQCVTCIT